MSGRRIRVRGRVQGVFFRKWAADAARALGLRGWVRNRLDGSVELAVFGDDEPIDALIEACRTGPPAAQVERIEVGSAEGEGAPSGFEVRETV